MSPDVEFAIHDRTDLKHQCGEYIRAGKRQKRHDYIDADQDVADREPVNGHQNNITLRPAAGNRLFRSAEVGSAPDPVQSSDAVCTHGFPAYGSSRLNYTPKPLTTALPV